MNELISARKLLVSGIVQGVGFRPFIHQLAGRHHLAGMVANTASGVTIHVEGQSDNLSSFCRSIFDDRPPLARITEIVSEDANPQGYADFTITQSRAQANRSTLISPDVAVCKDCLREVFDPDDRRFGYPFTNCTNCGPRYTIIDDIPYDRPHTSMKHFAMCPRCRAEYDDPANRRFHAQPNACPLCGPCLTLHDAAGKAIDPAAAAGDNDPASAAVRLLKAGYILAVKSLGGFHLAVDAGNSDAVARLRRRKHREEKPFALMAASLAKIRQFARVSPSEEGLLQGVERPIVLLQKRRPNSVAPNVAPDNQYFGVMLPAAPLHYLLLPSNIADDIAALVMTSGNISESPIVIDNDDAFVSLGGIADYFLTHNREIYLRCDDSIVRHAAGNPQILRRSRGYVPVPVFLKEKAPPILACGAALKNTICLVKDKNAFVSQHIGDLENPRAFDFYTATIDHMKQILDISPQWIAHDMHPAYFSTRYAQKHASAHQPANPVQHHHAHIASCMAEHRIDGPVIGLAFDGTGYGTDGRIWGGEVLIADETDFDRAAHLAYVPMPGGDAAVKAPWRMGISHLFDAVGDGLWDLDLPLFQDAPASDIDIVLRMMDKSINSPLTSSMGRLFDAVAAITGIRSRVCFEGQAAMALEMAACKDAILADTNEVYPYLLPPALQEQTWQNHSAPISTSSIIFGVVRDLQAGKDRAAISTRFHWTLIHLFCDVCDRIRAVTNLNRVVLSGGVFQNAVLLGGMIRMLTNRGFRVYAHSRIPSNDGGISLGQALVAASRNRF